MPTTDRRQLETSVQSLTVGDNTAIGKDYTAASAPELEKVLADLPIQKYVKKEPLEINVAFVALGGILAAGALVLGALWRPLP